MCDAESVAQEGQLSRCVDCGVGAVAVCATVEALVEAVGQQMEVGGVQGTG